MTTHLEWRPVRYGEGPSGSLTANLDDDEHFLIIPALNSVGAQEWALTTWYERPFPDDVVADGRYATVEEAKAAAIQHIRDTFLASMREDHTPNPDDVLVRHHPSDEEIGTGGCFIMVAPKNVESDLRRMTERGERPEVVTGQERERVLAEWTESAAEMTYEEACEL